MIDLETLNKATEHLKRTVGELAAVQAQYTEAAAESLRLEELCGKACEEYTAAARFMSSLVKEDAE